MNRIEEVTATLAAIIYAARLIAEATQPPLADITGHPSPTNTPLRAVRDAQQILETTTQLAHRIPA